MLLSSITTFAQSEDPYKIFGHNSTVEYKMPVTEMLYIKNKDTNSEIKAIAFDMENSKVKLLGSNDKVLSEVDLEEEQLLRWLSIDPLANKYPQTSPYNFVLNNPLNNIDPDGRDVVVLRNSSGAKGTGHGALLIGDDKNGWTYISKDGFMGSPLGSESRFIVKTFKNIEKFRNSPHNFETNETHSDNKGNETKNLTFKNDKDGNKIQRFDQAIYIPTIKADGTSTDAQAITSATASAKSTYCLSNGDCSDVITSALDVSKDLNGNDIKNGENLSTNILTYYRNNKPNVKYDRIYNRNKSAMTKFPGSNDGPALKADHLLTPNIPQGASGNW